jgi:hypothetical protein
MHRVSNSVKVTIKLRVGIMVNLQVRATELKAPSHPRLKERIPKDLHKDSTHGRGGVGGGKTCRLASLARRPKSNAKSSKERHVCIGEGHGRRGHKAEDMIGDVIG